MSTRSVEAQLTLIMIGALAIKRRRKKLGQVEAPPPVIKSRHCGFIYMLGGVCFVTGVILLIPAIVSHNNSTLFIISGSLLVAGVLILIIACCWSNMDGDEDEPEPATTDLTTLEVDKNLVETTSHMNVDMAPSDRKMSVLVDTSRSSSSTSPAFKYDNTYSNLPLVST